MHTSDIVIMRAAVPFEKSTDRNSSRSPTAAAVSGPLPYKVPYRKSSGEPFLLLKIKVQPELQGIS